MGKARKIEATYDPQVDALYLSFGQRRGIVISEDVAPGVLLDYDEKRRVVGIEILDASRFTPFVPSAKRENSSAKDAQIEILSSVRPRVMETPLSRETFSAPEIAELLNVHPSTVWRWLREGRILGKKTGDGKGTYVIPASELERLHEQKK